MKFVKEFPWVDVTEEEKSHVKSLYDDTREKLGNWYGRLKSKVKDKYPSYREKTKEMALKGLDFSKRNGRRFCSKVHEKAPVYWRLSKTKLSTFLKKIKERYGHRK